MFPEFLEDRSRLQVTSASRCFIETQREQAVEANAFLLLAVCTQRWKQEDECRLKYADVTQSSFFLKAC